jgi:hypothetical protein
MRNEKYEISNLESGVIEATIVSDEVNLQSAIENLQLSMARSSRLAAHSSKL